MNYFFKFGTVQDMQDLNQQSLGFEATTLTASPQPRANSFIFTFFRIAILIFDRAELLHNQSPLEPFCDCDCVGYIDTT